MCNLRTQGQTQISIFYGSDPGEGCKLVEVKNTAILNLKRTMSALKTQWDNSLTDAHGSVWLKPRGSHKKCREFKGGAEIRGNLLRSEPNLKDCRFLGSHGDQFQHHKAYLEPPAFQVFGYRRPSKRTHASDRTCRSRNKRLQIKYIYVRQQNKYAYSSAVWILCKRIIHS